MNGPGYLEKMSEITVDIGAKPLVGIVLTANHHHPTKPGKTGDPESLSEMTVAMSGFK